MITKDKTSSRFLKPVRQSQDTFKSTTVGKDVGFTTPAKRSNIRGGPIMKPEIQAKSISPFQNRSSNRDRTPTKASATTTVKKNKNSTQNLKQIDEITNFYKKKGECSHNCKNNNDEMINKDQKHYTKEEAFEMINHSTNR